MTYNEIEPFAVDWLQRLMAAGHIPAGVIQSRSIRDLTGADCGTSTHLFAGIGGWPLALRLAGWPDDRPCWTGSCPCQPFSAAGKRGGTSDARHLWPDMFRLVGERRPATIFGEQVASGDGLAWLDGIFADLENAGYTCGAADLCAAGVGAPHGRQRLFWGATLAVGDAKSQGTRLDERRLRGVQHANCPWNDAKTMSCQDGKNRRVGRRVSPLADGVLGGLGSSRTRRLKGYGNAIVPTLAATFVCAFMEAAGDG